MAKWSAADMPSLEGKVAVVTGANSGIGWETALELARHGAHVVLACRDAGRAHRAMEAIRGEVPGALLEFEALDVSSLESVRSFAKALKQPKIDLLVNNAGVMAIPRELTVDGFERQFGTNHLGHFALTGLLFSRLNAGGRIVSVSSNAHHAGRMDFDDLRAEKSYSKWGRYAQSKLANLLFTFELQRRIDAAGLALKALACHPGYSSTNLFATADTGLVNRIVVSVSGWAAQSARMGALPTLYAATSPEAEGGDYIGPGVLFQTRGAPKKCRPSARAKDPQAALRLWECSVSDTGVDFGSEDVKSTACSVGESAL